MEKSEAYRRGVETRKALFGEEGVKRAEAWSRIDQGLVDFLMESVWGGILSRPGLSRRDRELITLAALTALDKPRELDHHVNGALAAGLSKEEIIEVIVQMAVYAGVPCCLEGMRVAEKVFKERGLM
jgi:alkylhydroperoxidase/carboxymuconolactone decarboxylase family protein YurZ